VTVDGNVVGSINLAGTNQDYSIYTLSSLTYGSHTAQIDLLSSSGVASHFRLDKIDINETKPPVSTTVTSTRAFNDSSTGKFPLLLSLEEQ
jgi:hypothetical protein